VYAALLLERRAFDRLPAPDQAIVREVMERTYRQFDRNSIDDNRDAMQALLESGLELVKPESGEVQSWRDIVTRSHRQQALAGVFDVALLDELQSLLNGYRDSRARTLAVDQP